MVEVEVEVAATTAKVVAMERVAVITKRMLRRLETCCSGKSVGMTVVQDLVDAVAAAAAEAEGMTDQVAMKTVTAGIIAVVSEMTIDTAHALTEDMMTIVRSATIHAAGGKIEMIAAGKASLAAGREMTTVGGETTHTASHLPMTAAEGKNHATGMMMAVGRGVAHIALAEHLLMTAGRTIEVRAVQK